jgi:hypothetical protein
VPSIQADSGRHAAVHFRVSGLDLSGSVLAPCSLGRDGTGRQRPSSSGTMACMSGTYLRWYGHEGAGSSEELPLLIRCIMRQEVLAAVPRPSTTTPAPTTSAGHCGAP